MPAHMKKRRIKRDIAQVVWHGAHYEIPLTVIEKYKVRRNRDARVPVDDVFADLTSKYGEPAVLLKGLRYKEDLTQTEFAALIGVTQTNLSGMENGRRAIGKEIAKRIEKRFGVDYRLFL